MDHQAYFCCGCGCLTQRKDAFGQPLCEPCHEDEDDAVEAYEARQYRD